MKINNTFKLIIAVVVSELAGIIGSVFTTPSIAGWYAGIVKPALNPPAWVFGPVWTTLFALMGISAFLIWKKGLDRKDVKIALGIFVGQLVLNTLWSVIFFGLHYPGGAFFELIALWLAILATIIAFAKIFEPAAWLLVPYILWVSFAGYLNFNLWQLNNARDSVLDSEVRGAVLLGPTCPVEIIPPDPACADRPYKTVIQVIKLGSPQSSPFATTETNDQGQFSIKLPAGEYALQPIGGDPFPRCETKNVTVEANKINEINLSCDTGIR